MSSRFTILSLGTLALIVSSKANTPTGIFGICDKVGTFHKAEVTHKPSDGRTTGPLFVQPHTKVQFRPSTGHIVVKFKANLVEMCKNLSNVIGHVRGNLKKMLFRRNQRKFTQRATETFIPFRKA